MSGAMEISGVALVAEQRALDIIANNVANVNTPGFKRADVQFAQMIATQSDAENPSATLQTDMALAGVSARGVLSLNEPGELQQTGRALDLAIDGVGFIELMGPHGQTLLTRGGPLTINDDGQLAANGLPFMNGIAIPNGASDLRINADGVVTARVDGRADPVELGRISLVQVDDASAVEQMDGGLYRLREGATIQDGAPGLDGFGRFAQGALERSNVQMNDEMVRLLMVQRAYAANAQIVHAADEMLGIANGLRR